MVDGPHFHVPIVMSRNKINKIMSGSFVLSGHLIVPKSIRPLLSKIESIN